MGIVRNGSYKMGLYSTGPVELGWHTEREGDNILLTQPGYGKSAPHGTLINHFCAV